MILIIRMSIQLVQNFDEIKWYSSVGFGNSNPQQHPEIPAKGCILYSLKSFLTSIGDY